MDDPGELIVVLVILGLFGAVAAAGWRWVKRRPERLARLRKAPTMSVDTVSTARIFIVLPR